MATKKKSGAKRSRGSAGWWEKFPLGSVFPISPLELTFDVDNPRYSADKGLPHKKDTEIVRYLNETSDLGELLQSISTSGYVNIEPLVVCGMGKNLVVLEGNRRLAAVRVLLDPAFSKSCGIQPIVFGADVEATLDSLSVYRVESREDARDFIGFKHINGAHRWDSIAKARYAADWLRAEKKKRKNGLSLQDIARRMGDRHSTLQRMVYGYFVLDQALTEKLFDMDDREQGRQFAFSHLYTALSQTGYRNYLGLSDESRSAEPVENPIDPEYFGKLEQLLLWLYGSDSREIDAVVRSQNPHVKQLGESLDKLKARKILLESGDLARAYSEVDTIERQFERKLVAAHSATEDCMKKVASYSGDDPTILELAEELSANAGSILTILEASKSRRTSEHQPKARKAQSTKQKKRVR